jgi:hypothetical protein
MKTLDGGMKSMERVDLEYVILVQCHLISIHDSTSWKICRSQVVGVGQRIPR